MAHAVTVLDPQKMVVPGASLELLDLATNVTRTAVTQSAGNFIFVNLSPGKYRLTIGAQGFQKAVYDEVVVEGTKSTDIEATRLSARAIIGLRKRANRITYPTRRGR
jgi:hypothetical protein